MIHLSTLLKHYKRKDIQEEMVRTSEGREVAFRLGEGFGKRPDTLTYPGDVLEIAKQGATSFHVSEERWKNPLRLDTNMKRGEVEALRTGWDLVIDIDCPDWKISKLIAWLFVKSLREHGIKTISIKFSGNKGFHIGVPFEAFPDEFNETQLASLFPEAPHKIAIYLLNYIGENHTEVSSDNKITFGKKVNVSIQTLKKSLGKEFSELTTKHCKSCKKIVKELSKESKTEFICSNCENRVVEDADFMKCEKCGKFMEKMQSKGGKCKCGSEDFETRFNPLSVVEVDTILIASRHLYRSIYSLHEKSGLASIPIDPDRILSFKKTEANPDGLKLGKLRWLENIDVKKEEGRGLLEKAFHHHETTAAAAKDEEGRKNMVFEEIGIAVPEELFPPCIQKILSGIKDGKKRALFMLTNFLSNVGWDNDMIDVRLYEWNEKNQPALREVYLKGHLNYHGRRKEKVLPPNCDNKMYYKDLGICLPDGICKRIKNPVNYVRKRIKFIKPKKDEPKKLSKKPGKTGKSD